MKMVFRPILVSLLMAAWLGGTATATAQARKDSRVADLEKRLNQLLAPVGYHYNPNGKPNPFQPFLRSTKSQAPKGGSRAGKTGKLKKPEHCATPLECMDVGQLTVVAIISETNGGRVAMAQDAAGIGYTLRPGVRIGFRNGYVKAILPDRVIVAEKAQDIRGNTKIRNRVLLLHPEEE